MRRVIGMLAASVLASVAVGCVEPPPAPTITRVTNGNGTSVGASISADGEWVALLSTATDLTPEIDLEPGLDVYLAHVPTGQIWRVTNTTDTDPTFDYLRVSAHGESVLVRASADGLFGHGAASTYGDLYHWHRDSGIGTHVADAQYAGTTGGIFLSADGDTAFFGAEHTSLPDVVVSSAWTRTSGTVAPLESTNAGPVGGDVVSVSPLGTKALIVSNRGDLLPSVPDDDDDPDAFLLDVATGVIERLTTVGWDPLRTPSLGVSPYGGFAVNSSGDVVLRRAEFLDIDDVIEEFLVIDRGTGTTHAFSPPVPMVRLNDGFAVSLLENGHVQHVDVDVVSGALDIELLEINPSTGAEWTVMNHSMAFDAATPGFPLFPWFGSSADGRELVVPADSRDDDVAVDHNGGADVFVWSAGY